MFWEVSWSLRYFLNKIKTQIWILPSLLLGARWGLPRDQNVGSTNAPKMVLKCIIQSKNWSNRSLEAFYISNEFTMLLL